MSALSWNLNSIAAYQEAFEQDPDPELLVGRRGRGTGECWMPREPQRVLCPNHLIQNGFETAWINVYGDDRRFPLATAELTRLARLFRDARHAFEGLFEATGTGREAADAAVSVERR